MLANYLKTSFTCVFILLIINYFGASLPVRHDRPALRQTGSRGARRVVWNKPLFSFDVLRRRIRQASGNKTHWWDLRCIANQRIPLSTKTNFT